MRHAGSDAEARLWSRLRDRRLQGWKFRRQHPLGPFILDFYCPDARLAVELDGGGHALDAQAAYDAERTRNLGRCGIRILRFWNHVVLRDTDEVLEQILKALNEPLTPTLTPQAGRGGAPLTRTLSPQAGRGGASRA